MDNLRLTLISTDDVFTFNTNEKAVKIGRSSQCDFVIDREDISREHCLFLVQDEAFYITDLGSKNGIIVDESKLPPHTSARVTAESSIIISNKYVMKINAFDINTKADILLKKPHVDFKTSTFSLEIAEKPRDMRRRRTEKRPSVTEKDGASQNYESIKMILGFVAILALIIYHAFGR